MTASSHNAGDDVAAEKSTRAVEALISRRTAMGGVAFFGAAMSAIGSRAFAGPGALGSYSNSAIAADAGAWIMFAGTPYAYLHICGTPWDGNEYSPGDEAIWTMRYSKRVSG
jgi:hypothetical protein